MATGSFFQEEKNELLAWQTLQNLLNQNEQGKILLDRLLTGQPVNSKEMIEWFQAGSIQAPPEIKNYVLGGQVERLINIAQAGVVLIQPPSSISLSKDSFSGMVEWIYKTYQYLERVYPQDDSQILQFIEKACQGQGDITIFELEVFELVVNFCRFHIHKRIEPSAKFRRRTKKEYYSEMRKIIISKNKLQNKLSHIIGDPQLSKLVKQIEKNNGI